MIRVDGLLLALALALAYGAWILHGKWQQRRRLAETLPSGAGKTVNSDFNEFGGQVSVAPTTASGASPFVLDCNTSNNHIIPSLAGDSTASFSNTRAGARYSAQVIVNGHTFSFTGTVVFPSSGDYTLANFAPLVGTNPAVIVVDAICEVADTVRVISYQGYAS